MDVVAVEPADYAPLSRFHAMFQGDSRTPDWWLRRFRTWWDDNPSFDASCTRGWMLREDDGTITGFLGSIPSQFQVNHEEQRVFAATTWRVLPEHRRSSVYLYLAKIESQGSSLLFNTTPNGPVERILDYLHFRSLPSHRSPRRFLLAVDPGVAVRAYLRERLADLPDRVAAVPVVCAQLPLRIKLRGAAREVRVLEHADASIDDLWNRTRHRYAHTTVRSAAQVEWMCFANPDAPKTLLGCYDGGVLRGIAIFAHARWRGMRVLDLADLWTDGSREEVASALLAGAWAHAREDGHAVIALYDFAAGDAALFRRLGVFIQAPDTRKHYYRSPGTSQATLALHESCLTGLEGDRFL